MQALRLVVGEGAGSFPCGDQHTWHFGKVQEKEELKADCLKALTLMEWVEGKEQR